MDAEDRLLPDRAPGDQAEALGDVAEPAPLGRGAAHVDAAVGHGPGVRPEQPGEGPQRDRLARARRSDDRQAVAALGVRHPQAERPDGGVEVEAHRRRRPRHGSERRRDRPAPDAGRAPDAADGDRQRGDAEGEDRRGLGLRQRRGGEQVVDVDREAVGVVGEDHGRAVLPEGPQPHQDHPGPDAVRRGGHVDPQEPGQRAVAEGGGDVAQGRVDGAEGAAGHHDQERQRRRTTGR